jgi:hypothetical protein
MGHESCGRSGYSPANIGVANLLYAGLVDSGTGKVEYTYVVVSAHLPARPAVNLGVLLLEESSNRLHFRFRTDVDSLADPEDATVLRGVSEMLAQIAAEDGAAAMLRYLEETASNVIRVTDRSSFEAPCAEDALQRIYAAHVGH